MACHPRWSRLIILHRKYYILFSDKLNFHCRTDAVPPICRLQLIPLFLELMIGLSFYWMAGVTESSWSSSRSGDQSAADVIKARKRCHRVRNASMCFTTVQYFKEL